MTRAQPPLSPRRVRGVLWYGETPVPATAMWTGERNQGSLKSCRHANGRLALWAPERPGDGRPMFKNPHPVRQRRAMDLGLCDVCARSLKTRTKYLVGNLRAVRVSREGGMWTTQEPLVCSDCLPLAMTHCPFVRSWPAMAAGWEPIVVRKRRLIATIVDVEALELVAGSGVYPSPAVAYLKLAPC